MDSITSSRDHMYDSMVERSTTGRTAVSATLNIVSGTLSAMACAPAAVGIASLYSPFGALASIIDPASQNDFFLCKVEICILARFWAVVDHIAQVMQHVAGNL